MKSGIAPANFAITDWEGSLADITLCIEMSALPPKADIRRLGLQCPQSANSRHEEVYIAAPH